MAYTPSDLALITQPIGNRGIRFYSFKTDDPASSVTATDYFAAGGGHGLREGDLIFVSSDTGSTDSYVAVVREVDALGNATAMIVEERGFNVAHVGALGDGATSDQAAFQRAATLGGVWQVSPGTYPVDQIVVPAGVTFGLVGSSSAIIKQNSTPAVTNSLISSTAGGSVYLNGVTLDGDYDNKIAEFISIMTANGIDTDAGRFFFWMAMESTGDGSTILRDVTMRGFCAQAFHIYTADTDVSNVRVNGCGAGGRFRNFDRLRVHGLHFDDCGNGDAKIYPHLLIVRLGRDAQLSDITATRFAPTEASREPGPAVFQIERVRGVRLSGYQATEYLGVTTGSAAALLLQSLQDATIHDVLVDGVDTALETSTVQDCVVSNLRANGFRAPKGSTNPGVYIASNGVTATVGAGGSNPRAIRSTRGLTLVAPQIMGFEKGIWCRGEATVVDCNIRSNTKGLLVQNSVSTRFYGATGQPAHLTVIGGKNKYNSGIGLHVESGSVTVRGLDNRNNGQDSALTSNSRSSVNIADSADVLNVRVIDSFLGDDQSGTVTLGASFIPGTMELVATDRYQYQIYLRNPDKFEVGQRIKLIDAGGTGVDHTVTIVESYDDTAPIYGGDQVTVEAASALEFVSDGSNTFTLTGDWTDTAIEEDEGEFIDPSIRLLGESADALAQLIGPTAIYFAGDDEWRIVTTVQTNQDALPDHKIRINQPFTTLLNADALSFLAVDIEGIPSTVDAIRITGASMAGKLYTVGNDYTGATRDPVNNAVDDGVAGNTATDDPPTVTFTKWAPGSRFRLGNNAANGWALVTDGPETIILDGLLQGWILNSAVLTIESGIGGLTGSTVTATIETAAGTFADLGDFGALTVGTTFLAAIAPTPLPDDAWVQITCAGGADNNPSTGRVSVALSGFVPDLTL